MTTRYIRVEEHVMRNRFQSRTCDWCGIEMGENYGQECDSGGERDFSLHFRQGNTYPGSGYMAGWCVPDLCDSCVAKLKRLLEDNGIKVVASEVDW